MRTIFSSEMENKLSSHSLAVRILAISSRLGPTNRASFRKPLTRAAGWNGLLVEPQPRLADELRRQRSAKVFAVACSSRRNSGTRMPLHLAGPHSSFDERLNLATVRPHGLIEVPVRTLDDILIEAGAPRIDFISIDVEGHELEVLDGLNLARWSPG